MGEEVRKRSQSSLAIRLLLDHRQATGRHRTFAEFPPGHRLSLDFHPTTSYRRTSFRPPTNVGFISGHRLPQDFCPTTGCNRTCTNRCRIYAKPPTIARVLPGHHSSPDFCPTTSRHPTTCRNLCFKSIIPILAVVSVTLLRSSPQLLHCHNLAIAEHNLWDFTGEVVAGEVKIVQHRKASKLTWNPPCEIDWIPVNSSPVSKLLWRSSCPSSVNLPKDFGNGPVSRLSLAENSKSLLSEPISAGISPLN
ncbi:hypothetical protein M5K25_024656 [Dendrobium thyrsiflorum]|uniref:Uncharacterized protein n=1 Tax=Dendrobium thyrsiflorum TaxID=117978 RepID=A0ABD0U2T0_DENTH